LQVLSQIDAAQRGEVGAILRREGLYSSLITEWRKQRDRGALEGLRDRKPGPAGKDPVRAELARLRQDNARLREHVAICEELIGTQGKAFALLQTISAGSSATPGTTRPTR
jgi:transposase-like protein